MKATGFIALAGLVLSVLGAEPSGAQSVSPEGAQPSTAQDHSTAPGENASTNPTSTETQFDAWKKICVHSDAQQKHVCGLAYAGLPETPESLITKSSPLIAVTVQSARGGDDAQPILVIRTKLGLLLPGGLELRVDRKKPVKAAFRSCHANRVEAGCLVPIRLKGAFVRDLKRGITLTVTAKTLQGGVMTQQISLLGVTGALNALQSDQDNASN